MACSWFFIMTCYFSMDTVFAQQTSVGGYDIKYDEKCTNQPNRHLNLQCTNHGKIFIISAYYGLELCDNNPITTWTKACRVTVHEHEKQYYQLLVSQCSGESGSCNAIQATQKSMPQICNDQGLLEAYTNFIQIKYICVPDVSTAVLTNFQKSSSRSGIIVSSYYPRQPIHPRPSPYQWACSLQSTSKILLTVVELNLNFSSHISCTQNFYMEFYSDIQNDAPKRQNYDCNNYYVNQTVNPLVKKIKLIYQSHSDRDKATFAIVYAGVPSTVNITCTQEPVSAPGPGHVSTTIQSSSVTAVSDKSSTPTSVTNAGIREPQSDTGGITGGILGGIAIALLIAVAVVLVYRYRKNKTPFKKEKGNINSTANSMDKENRIGQETSGKQIQIKTILHVHNPNMQNTWQQNTINGQTYSDSSSQQERNLQHNLQYNLTGHLTVPNGTYTTTDINEEPIYADPQNPDQPENFPNSYQSIDVNADTTETKRYTPLNYRKEIAKINNPTNRSSQVNNTDSQYYSESESDRQLLQTNDSHYYCVSNSKDNGSHYKSSNIDNNDSHYTSASDSTDGNNINKQNRENIYYSAVYEEANPHIQHKVPNKSHPQNNDIDVTMDHWTADETEIYSPTYQDVGVTSDEAVDYYRHSYLDLEPGHNDYAYTNRNFSKDEADNSQPNNSDATEFITNSLYSTNDEITTC